MPKIARFISLLGHPFLTIPLYTILISFSAYESKKAFFIAATIIGIFFIPLSIWNFVRTRKGDYSNFDVSDQRQRTSMYLFALPLLAVVQLVFFLTSQAKSLQLCILFSLILLVISYLVNFKVKCSGHMSMTIFLAFIVFPGNTVAAWILLGLAVIIGWSRIILKRHTLTEVITGMIIGTVVGLCMNYFQGIPMF